ncbi:hypothetical protein KSI86_05910 [Dickeya oryzae]|uniref:hypothetical protein n=1 Tax=Dickeya oryzae TaxID=1240404 RepID=UPI00209753F1|nr:hypothetical protein [Dickeya oryzae]MCO7253694.1 hypothetical protein [Dickeya oryzae]UUE09404.1 hypothetical protein NMX13_17385 [Dickeya zeae]
MKLPLTYLIILLSFQSYASINLKKPEPIDFSRQLTEKATPLEISDISIEKNQVFEIERDGIYIGTLIPAEGYYKKYNPLCFIGWSTDKKEISNIVPSIGQGDFENSTCLSLDAVGKIDVRDKTFIGFVYTVGLRDRRAKNYFLIEIDKDKKTITDKSTIVDELQNNGEKKSIASLRKYLENAKEKKE